MISGTNIRASVGIKNDLSTDQVLYCMIKAPTGLTGDLSEGILGVSYGSWSPNQEKVLSFTQVAPGGPPIKVPAYIPSGSQVMKAAVTDDAGNLLDDADGGIQVDDQALSKEIILDYCACSGIDTSTGQPIGRGTQFTPGSTVYFWILVDYPQSGGRVTITHMGETELYIKEVPATTVTEIPSGHTEWEGRHYFVGMYMMNCRAGNHCYWARYGTQTVVAQFQVAP